MTLLALFAAFVRPALSGRGRSAGCSRTRPRRPARRLSRQPVPEGEPQLHPARDPGARAAGRRGRALRRSRLGRRIAGCRRPRRARAHPLPAARRPGGAARRGAGDGGDAAAPLRAGARGSRCVDVAPVEPHPVPITSPTWPRPAAWCSGPRRPGRSTCTRTSAPIRPRWRCWRACSAGRPTASPCTAPRSSTAPARSASARRSGARPSSSRSARSAAASSIAGCRRPTGPRSRSCTAASTQAFHRGAPAEAPGGAAAGLRRPPVRAEGPAAAGRGGASAVVAAGRPLELVLAGDGEMRAEIEALIDALGLRDQRAHHRLDRQRPRCATRSSAARALVLPSFAEGLPVVIMEAMALRRPVITHLRRRHPRAGARRRERLAGAGRRRRRRWRGAMIGLPRRTAPTRWRAWARRRATACWRGTTSTPRRPSSPALFAASAAAARWRP